METAFWIMASGFLIWGLVLAVMYLVAFLKIAFALISIGVTILIAVFSFGLLIASWLLYPLILPFSFLVMVFLDLPIKPFKWIFRDKSPAIFKRLTIRYWKGCNSLRKMTITVGDAGMKISGLLVKICEIINPNDEEPEIQDPMLTMMAMQYFKKGQR